jgi:NADPH:quinone reductase-like Zn-dependent oxidoreductase
MLAIVCTRPGAPDVLEAREIDAPSVGDTDVLIRAEAIGVNFGDLFTRHHESVEDGDVLGFELAGVVEETGSAVTRFAVGDRVAAIPLETGRAYAELVAVPEARVYRVPEGVSPEVAAAIPVAYTTAYAALHHHAQVREGELVLVHSAAGGVGLAAVQLAARAGARVVATASASKRAFLEAQPGVEAVFDRATAWDEEIDGVDVILDGNLDGGDLARNLKLLRWGGRLVSYGNASTTSIDSAAFGVRPALSVPFEHVITGRGIFGVHSGQTPPETMRDWAETALAWAADGTITPEVKTFPLRDAAAAHLYVHEGRNVGKIVLVP